MDQLKNMEEKSLGRASCQSCKYWTIFIFLSILFSVSFHLSSLFYLGLGQSVMSHVTVTVTRSCDTEKVIEDSGTDDII